MNEFKKEKTFTKRAEESKSVFKCFKKQKGKVKRGKSYHNIERFYFVLYVTIS